MGIGDTWNRALVYFGLAEDPDYRGYDDPDADFDEAATMSEEIEPAPRRGRGGNVRRLRHDNPDDIDDIFADEPRRARNLRPVQPGGGGGSENVQVHFVTPRNFNDAQEIGEKFKRGIPVILNLQTAQTDLSKRLIDFASGLTYALDGGMSKIADKTFMLTPANVEVSAEEKARLVEKGFFNQS